MAVTGTKTVRQIVTAALRKAQVTAIDLDPEAAEAEEAREELNRMLKAWQNKRYNLWTKASASLPLTTAASYTLDPIRPLRILTARYTASGVEIPMYELSRQEYDELPQKAATGTPTQFHYDKQREAAKLYVWPLLATASGETIEYTYERELEDIDDLDAVIDVPGEWWDAVVLNLACRMAETFNTPIPQTTYLRADAELMQALGDDQEASVYFGPEDY